MFTYKKIGNFNSNYRISVIFETKSKFVLCNFDNMKKYFCEPQLLALYARRVHNFLNCVSYSL